MRNRFRLIPFLLLMCFACCSSRASDLALIHAKIYPSPTEPPIENGTILLGDGRIVAVGPTSKVKIPRDTETIDCRGLVVTAGFWNSHVHILPPLCSTPKKHPPRSSPPSS